MKLYDSPDCPFAGKVRIVLVENDMEFETISVDLESGEQRSESFLKLNPFAKVPVLIDGEGDEEYVVYDSTIINEYLNDEYVLDLLPEDMAERARIRLLEDFADNAFTLPVMAIEREMKKPETARDEERVSKARTLIGEGLQMLDSQLSGREYLGGDFSLADVAFAPAALRLESIDAAPAAGLSNVNSWISRLRGRASVAQLG